MNPRSFRGRMPRRLLTVISSAALFAGLSLAAAPAALAADPDTSASNAAAQFLSGTGGVNASYTGDGSETAGTADEASDAIGSLISTIPGLEINGALGSEYAYAGPGGQSWAASGWVTGAGDGGAANAANVNIDLGALLAAAGIPNNFVEKLELSLLELGSVAKLDLQQLGDNALADSCGVDPQLWGDDEVTNCRDYRLKSGALSIESNALKGVTGEIQAVAAQIDAAIGTYYSGVLPSAISDALIAPVNAWLQDEVVGERLVDTSVLRSYVTAAGIDPASSVIDATVSGTVASALAEIFAGAHTVNGVTVNLGAGTIDIDYDHVLGGLNHLPANSPLFGSAVVSSITSSMDQILDDLAAEVAAAIPTLLDAVTIDISGTLAGSLTVRTDGRFCLFSCTPWSELSTDTYAAGATIGYTGTLWDLLSVGETVSVAATIPLPSPLPDLTLPSLNVDLGEVVPGGILGSVTGSAIAAVTQSIADLLKPVGAAVIDGIAGLLNSASSVFNGTINAQTGNADDGYQVSALVLRFGADAAAAATPSPLRAGTAFHAAVPRPAAPMVPAATIRLGTATVGPNRVELICPAGTHYAGGTCVADTPVDPGGPGTPPGPGTPGGGGTTPTDAGGGGGTPAIDVEGVSGEAGPEATPVPEITTPEVEVLGVSKDVSAAPDQLAATGPRQSLLLALGGLEVLLAGIAIARLGSRGARARA